MTHPTALSELVVSLARKWGWRHPLEEARLVWAWEDIVGEAIARKTTPTGLKDGRLRVRCTSAPWAAELKWMGPSVVSRINDALGANIVQEIVPWVSDAPPPRRRATRPVFSSAKPTLSTDPHLALESAKKAALQGKTAPPRGR